MTEPTDQELAALRAEFGITSNGRGIKEFTQVRDFARAVLAKWGTPAGAGAPVAPDFYTTCAWYEGGGEAGWIPLPGYSSETEHGVKHLVLDAARKEGYKGTAAGRLLELGWEIRPVYLAPQPTQAQAGAVPPEAEPIVLNCEAPGDLKPGDYVFASRWSDCDPGDPWEVGFVSEVGVYPKSMTKAGYVVLQGGSRRWGRAMRITPEQGRRICEQFPSMERLPQDYDAIARVFGIKGGQHGTDI